MIHALKKPTIKLRLANESDAAFILSLRLNSELNSYLSMVDGNLYRQINWLRQYKIEEMAGRQYYFVIERIDGIPCGTVRVYDIKSDSFGWGSWILNHDKTRTAAFESALLVYDFGFNNLGFMKSHFEVRKDNLLVIKFHEKMGAKKIGDDVDNFHYEITKEAVDHFFESYKGKLL